MDQMQRDMKPVVEEQGINDETEDHADRRHAISLGGPRNEFPELVELDTLVLEIRELEAKGQLAGYPDWREDVTAAESIFLEAPSDVAKWLERMRIKLLSEPDKRIKVVELAQQLVADSIIAVPPQTWSARAPDPDREPSKEELLVFRMGFVFVAYRVDFWWWESVEM